MTYSLSESSAPNPKIGTYPFPLPCPRCLWMPPELNYKLQQTINQLNYEFQPRSIYALFVCYRTLVILYTTAIHIEIEIKTNEYCTGYQYADCKKIFNFERA